MQIKHWWKNIGHSIGWYKEVIRLLACLIAAEFEKLLITNKPKNATDFSTVRDADETYATLVLEIKSRSI